MNTMLQMIFAWVLIVGIVQAPRLRVKKIKI